MSTYDELISLQRELQCGDNERILVALASMAVLAEQSSSPHGHSDGPDGWLSFVNRGGLKTVIRFLPLSDPSDPSYDPSPFTFSKYAHEYTRVGTKKTGTTQALAILEALAMRHRLAKVLAKDPLVVPALLSLLDYRKVHLTVRDFYVVIRTLRCVCSANRDVVIGLRHFQHPEVVQNLAAVIDLLTKPLGGSSSINAPRPSSRCSTPRSSTPGPARPASPRPMSAMGNNRPPSPSQRPMSALASPRPMSATGGHRHPSPAGSRPSTSTTPPTSPVELGKQVFGTSAELRDNDEIRSAFFGNLVILILHVYAGRSSALLPPSDLRQLAVDDASCCSKDPLLQSLVQAVPVTAALTGRGYINSATFAVVLHLLWFFRCGSFDPHTQSTADYEISSGVVSETLERALTHGSALVRYTAAQALLHPGTLDRPISPHVDYSLWFAALSSKADVTQYEIFSSSCFEERERQYAFTASSAPDTDSPPAPLLAAPALEPPLQSKPRPQQAPASIKQRGPVDAACRA